MIVLKGVSGGRIAIHKENILDLIEQKDVIFGGYKNTNYVKVSLREPNDKAYNVLNSLEEIIEMMKMKEVTTLEEQNISLKQQLKDARALLDVAGKRIEYLEYIIEE